MEPGLPVIAALVVWERIPVQAQPPQSVILVSPTPTDALVTTARSVPMLRPGIVGQRVSPVPTVVIALASVSVLVVAQPVNTTAEPAPNVISVSNPTSQVAQVPL